MRRVLIYVVISFLLLIIHSTFADLITLGPAIPDVLLIWVVYLAIVEGQLAGTVAGFLIGLCADFMSGSDGMLGLSALTKTLAGFLAGYFHNVNKTEITLSGAKFVVAVGIVSLLHNALYFLIFLQGTETEWWRSIVIHGFPSTLYTVLLATVPMWMFRRKYQA